jgi:hypothetical protein
MAGYVWSLENVTLMAITTFSLQLGHPNCPMSILLFVQPQRPHVGCLRQDFLLFIVLLGARALDGP